jgi:hypothetical protein
MRHAAPIKGAAAFQNSLKITVKSYRGIVESVHFYRAGRGIKLPKHSKAIDHHQYQFSQKELFGADYQKSTCKAREITPLANANESFYTAGLYNPNTSDVKIMVH